ncbi:indole-3-glycerol phosphate synthase [bacterium A37T11]|nr:indole-3-glycerol phosphate synthase [bacterium A37T11]
MNILDQIIERKKAEVLLAKNSVSLDTLQHMPLFGRICLKMLNFVTSPYRNGIIAEFKRASPSKGMINQDAAVDVVVKGYELAGASAVSVLTDSDFFHGSLDDLLLARQSLLIPLLRKDFIIDTYQIAEAKAHGADIILLIAAVLSPAEINQLASYAKALGLNVLLEVHNREELDRSLSEYVDAVGVNNRDLTDFSVSIDHSLELVDLIPASFIKVSESGISDPATINQLKKAGFDAFLIGENFMKTNDPVRAIQSFTSQLNGES